MAAASRETRANPRTGLAGFIPGVQSSKRFVVPAGEGEPWVFHLDRGLDEHGASMLVWVESEGRDERAACPEQVRWFNAHLEGLGVRFGGAGARFESFAHVEPERVRAVEHLLLTEGRLHVWWLRTFSRRGARRIVAKAPPGRVHEELTLSLRALPGEPLEKVRYAEVVTCGPHDAHRYTLWTRVHPRRGKNRASPWLRHLVAERGVKATCELPAEDQVEGFTMSRTNAVRLWREALALEAVDLGWDEDPFSHAMATWELPV